MIYVKLSSNNQILDVSITEKDGYIEVDNASVEYPFNNCTLPMICCYRIEVENTIITKCELAVPDKVFFAVRAASDAAQVQAGDDATLITCYELFGGSA